MANDGIFIVMKFLQCSSDSVERVRGEYWRLGEVTEIKQGALCGPVRVKVGVKDNQTTNTQVTAIM